MPLECVFALQTLLVLVQYLLNELCAKEFISHRQCEEFMHDAYNTAVTVRQSSDQNCRLQQQVASVSCALLTTLPFSQMQTTH